MAGGLYRGSLAARGLSLVELLVALAIGVVLAFAATHFLLRSKLSFLQSDELARLRENGFYALRLLSHELTMAGHLGSEIPGASIASSLRGSACFEFLLDTTSAVAHVNDGDVAGVSASGGSSLPEDCLPSRQHQAGSDILVVRRTSGEALVAAGEVRAAPDADALYLRSRAAQRPAAIARGGDPGVPGELWEYTPAVFFVRSHSRIRGDGIPTLCRKRPGRTDERMAPVECLVEGIENLQLEFGIDDDGDLQPDRFATRPAVAELRRAVAARIHLLVRSVQPVPGHSDDNDYQLAGKHIPASHDAYYRRLVQATLLLRNNAVFQR